MIPNYLKGYEDIYSNDKKAANLEWFKDAKLGMFIHYGLYSQLGMGEWTQFKQEIPVAEYAKLYDTFDPKNFDADFITDLACESEMKYINLVTCHHEGFPLFNSAYEPFNSYNAVGRDLLFELKEQCDKKGLGFFTYFTFLLNWRYPHHLSNDIIQIARPDYKTKQPEYLTDDIKSYKEHYYVWVQKLVEELLTNYGDIAGMWLDIIMGYYIRPDLAPYEEVKALIKKHQPQALLSFKQGADGSEDFATPEQHFHSLKENCLRQTGDMEIAQRADYVWNLNKHKHNEICATLQDSAWGYKKGVRHKTKDDILTLLSHSSYHDCNLLLNTGPLPDGSIHTDDVKSLKELGKHIRANGWPVPKLVNYSDDKSAEIDN